jgi:hypothetical protein
MLNCEFIMFTLEWIEVQGKLYIQNEVG